MKTQIKIENANKDKTEVKNKTEIKKQNGNTWQVPGYEAFGCFGA